MSQFWTSIKEVRKNYKPYDEWEQQQADDVAKRAYLSKILDLPKDEVELTRAKAEAVFRASDMMDKRSEDNCANMEQATGFIGLPIIFGATAASGPITLTIMNLFKHKLSAKQNAAALVLIQNLIILAPVIGFILWGNGKQKEASRIGRFQAKQHELKDVKNFVLYNSEQIEAARILAKNMKNKKDVKGLAKAFQDMKQMSVDKKAYKKWLQERIKNPEDIQKILNTDFSPEQLAQGEKDKEIIVNIVKDVNMNAETYAENVENVFDTLSMLSFLAAVPACFGANKILNKIKNCPPVAKFLVPILIPLAIPLGITIWSTKANKKASKIGRFVKRKEIINNPELIMAYSDEQLKMAENIKAPKQQKGMFKKTIGNITFFKQFMHDKKEYEQYVKTELKENDKLYDALKQTEVSEEQLKEAKHLQKSTFRAFDKMDEMSQRYSEDSEAASEIFKETIGSFVFPIAAFGIPALLGALLIKGKLPLHKFVKLASKITLKKDSSIRQSLNKFYNAINNNKELRKDVCHSATSKEALLRVMSHFETKNFLTEIESCISKHSPGITNAKDPKPIIDDFIQLQLKQNRISKWLINLGKDISKVAARVLKGEKEPIKQTKNGLEALVETIKFYWKEHKALVQAGLVSLIPSIAILFGGPFVLNSFLTNIQIKAGRIGIMKAMQEIDNAKLFVNTEEGNNET